MTNLFVFLNVFIFVNEALVETVNYGLESSDFFTKVCGNFQVDFSSYRLLLLKVALLK